LDFTSTSRGAQDAHRPIVLNNSGVLDASLGGGGGGSNLFPNGIGAGSLATVDYNNGDPLYTERHLVDVNETMTDPELGTYTNGRALYGAQFQVTTHITSPSIGATGNIALLGLYAVALVDAGSTTAPGQIIGARYFVQNSSDLAPDVYGFDCGAFTVATDDTSQLYGQNVRISNFGTGRVSEAILVNLRAPDDALYDTVVGVRVADLSGITGATEKYAILTNGGETLHKTGAAAVTGVVVQGATSQSANLQEWQDDSNNILSAIGPGGEIKTSQVAANTNTPGGATVGAMPIYDAAGSLIGYIPVYGSAW
jgi:hypothetical protein